jgi:hypothetical protein
VISPAATAATVATAAAAPVPARARRAFHRLTVPTCLAIQATVAVAVALPIGYLISPAHYVWALVAVFIVFLGPPPAARSP